MDLSLARSALKRAAALAVASGRRGFGRRGDLPVSDDFAGDLRGAGDGKAMGLFIFVRFENSPAIAPVEAQTIQERCLPVQKALGLSAHCTRCSVSVAQPSRSRRLMRQ